MPRDWDLKELSIETPPAPPTCRRCHSVNRRLQEAYAMGVRDEHRRWEAMREQEEHDRLRERFRRRYQRRRRLFWLACTLMPPGLAALTVLIAEALR